MAECCADLITQGLALGCETNSAGVRKIFITDFCGISAITHDNSDDSVIDGITLAGSPTPQYWEFESYKEKASFASSLKVTDNGGTFYEQNIKLTIPKMQSSKRTKLAQLVNKDLSVIVLDQNGIYWMLGELNGMRLTERPAESGAKRDDYNGYTLTITGLETEDARVLDASVVTALGL